MKFTFQHFSSMILQFALGFLQFPYSLLAAIVPVQDIQTATTPVRVNNSFPLFLASLSINSVVYTHNCISLPQSAARTDTPSTSGGPFGSVLLQPPSGPFAPLNSTIRDYDLSTGENGFSSSTRVNLNFEDSFSSTGFLILIDANGPDNFSVQLTDSQGVLRGTRINVTTAQYGNPTGDTVVALCNVQGNGQIQVDSFRGVAVLMSDFGSFLNAWARGVAIFDAQGLDLVFVGLVSGPTCVVPTTILTMPAATSATTTTTAATTTTTTSATTTTSTTSTTTVGTTPTSPPTTKSTSTSVPAITTIDDTANARAPTPAPAPATTTFVGVSGDDATTVDDPIRTSLTVSSVPTSGDSAETPTTAESSAETARVADSMIESSSITDAGDSGAIADANKVVDNAPPWIYVVTGVVTLSLITCIIVGAWLAVRHGELRLRRDEAESAKEFRSAVYDADDDADADGGESGVSRPSKSKPSGIYDAPPPGFGSDYASSSTPTRTLRRQQ